MQSNHEQKQDLRGEGWKPLQSTEHTKGDGVCPSVWQHNVASLTLPRQTSLIEEKKKIFWIFSPYTDEVRERERNGDRERPISPLADSFPCSALSCPCQTIHDFMFCLFPVALHCPLSRAPRLLFPEPNVACLPKKLPSAKLAWYSGSTQLSLCHPTASLGTEDKYRQRVTSLPGSRPQRHHQNSVSVAALEAVNWSSLKKPCLYWRSCSGLARTCREMKCHRYLKLFGATFNLLLAIYYPPIYLT